MRKSSSRPRLLRACSVVALAALAPAPSIACGGAAPPPAAPVVASAPPPAAPPPPPDLGPVPEPKGIVVTGRLGKLGSSLAMVHAWSKLPMPQSEQLTEVVTSEAVGPIVDPDQPVDFVVAVSGAGLRIKPVAAISAAVKDPEKAKASLADRFKLVPGDNGTTLIKGLGGGRRDSQDDDDDDSDGKPDSPSGDDDGGRVCELAPSYGDAPVRIVCAWSSGALSDLGPWLTRTFTRTATKSDLHVEVKMAPLRTTIDEGKRMAGVMIGGALSGAVRSQGLRDLVGSIGTDMADFASDIEGASLDVALADAGALMTTTLTLSGTSSAMGRLAVGHPERSGPAPASFWQLPGDADLAFFERGIDEAQISRARDLLLDGIGAGLVDEGVKPADAKALTAPLGKLISGAPAAYASGLDLAAVRKALAAESALGSDADPGVRQDARHATAEQLLGWRVLEVDQAPATITGALKDLSAAIGRPSLAAAIRAHDKEAGIPALRSAPMPRGAALPPGSLHWVLELPAEPQRAASKPGKKVAPPKPTLVHVLVAPDGARTWVGIGGDDSSVASHVASSLGSTGDKLSGRADLASFKDAKVGAGGFMTARSFLEIVLQLGAMGGRSNRFVGEALDDLEAMPQKGMSPLTFSSTAQPGGPPATTVSTLSVPRGTIEDVVTTVLRHGGF
jgi:hypothetical protein